MEIKPIAFIKTPFTQKFGIPRQSLRAESAEGTISVESEFCDENAFSGLEKFSHIWLIFDFSEAHREKWSPTVRPPRLGGNKRVGVFATRSPFRPNNLGLTVCRLLKIYKDNGKILLKVSGIDLLNGTPIYDIKPYIPYADSIPEAEGSFAESEKSHKLNIIISEELKSLIPKNIMSVAAECLSEDPRPSYHSDGKEYTMRLYDYDFTFFVEKENLTVKKIEKIKE